MLNFKPVASLLAIAGSLFVTSCGSINAQKEKKELLTMPVTALVKQDIDLPKTYICDIQAVQHVEVLSRLEAYVESIHVDEGQFVRKDQVLFKLNSKEFTEEVNKAKANLRQALARLKAAELEVEKLRTLVKGNVISATELELAKANKDVAESEVQVAQAMLQNANTNLSYTVVKAPFDGIMDRIHFKTGSLVTPGDLLTFVTDIKEVFAYYKVNENEYLQYMRERDPKAKGRFPQQEVTLVLSDGSVYEYPGIVEAMEGDFERGTGSIAFRVRFPNPNGLLKHGATGKIKTFSSLKDIYLIPQKSTFEIQNYTYVYIVDPTTNMVKVRSFEPITRYGHFYVAKDFEEGLQIVYEGVQTAKDGMIIQPEFVSMHVIMEEYQEATVSQVPL
jgi:membrane fusion protein (multidrug efflux system)